jgi:hypothetical protein
VSDLASVASNVVITKLTETRPIARMIALLVPLVSRRQLFANAAIAASRVGS